MSESNWMNFTRQTSTQTHIVFVPLTCLKCKCEWQARADHLKRCPNCGSADAMPSKVNVQVPLV